MPANYFEVLPDNTETGAEATGEEGYNYEYDAGGYDYDGGGTDDHQQTQQPADADPLPPSSSSTPSSPPPPSSNQHPPISESAAYIEQMKCWGDILQSQKDEKAKLEKQAAEAEEQLVVHRKAAFYYQQLDYMLHEVLKLMTEMDLDLDASVLFQRAQLAIIRDIKAIKDTADSVKLEVHTKRHLDEKIDELNTKLNNSMQLLENCDKTRKTFYTDLYSLQNFLEEVETRRKVEEEERRRLEEEERRRQEEEDAEWE